MSIFSRVYNILRANFNAGRNDDTPPVDSSNREKKRNRWETGSDQGGSAESGQDPKIAQYYANLELPYGADLETVTKAWKRLLKQYHPDKHSGDSVKQKTANELVQQLNYAYDQLQKHLSG